MYYIINLYIRQFTTILKKIPVEEMKKEKEKCKKKITEQSRNYRSKCKFIGNEHMKRMPRYY